MERKVGEIFEYNGEWYQCIECDSCGKCSLRTTECGSGTKSDIADEVFGECSKVRRTDNKHAIFKKLEKVGEPFTCNYYGDSRLIMMQEYKVYNTHMIYLNNAPMYVTDKMHGRIAIELKQSKKDMEEKKLNLKEFDLEAAKAGEPVCTRDGRKVRIISFDRKFSFKGVSYPIIALVEDTAKEEIIYGYNEKGKILIENDMPYKDDLMMLPEKKEGWVNLCKNNSGDTLAVGVFPNREEAVSNCPPFYLCTIKIEWEE